MTFIDGVLLLNLIVSHFFIVILIDWLLKRILKPHSRNYQIYDPKEDILIKDKKATAQELAHKYKPLIEQSVQLRGPDPSFMFYEVVKNNDMHLTIIYRVVWPDEVHPNPIIHFIYKAFRIFYYGSYQDMELIVLKIERKTGQIAIIKYETDSSANPDVFISDHTKVTFKRRFTERKENIFSIHLNGKYSGETELSFKRTHPKIPVLTWNHVFAIKKRDNEEYKVFDLPLALLTEYYYQKFRFDRRSCIDFCAKK